MRSRVLGTRRALALLVPLALCAAGCVVEATWTPQAVTPVVDPVPDRVTLVDVSCPAPGACIAVGSLGTTPIATEALVLRQADEGWQRVPIPAPLGNLRGVSCAAVDDCVVLGDVDLSYDGEVLAPLPRAPVGDDSSTSALDCTPTGGCLQVDGSSSSWWDGSAWSAPADLPAGLKRTDAQLSCASATSCLLVTTDFGVEGWPTPATVTSSTWDGSSWSSVVTLDHATRALDLDCATSTACFATAGVRADYWTGLLGPVPAEVLRWDGAAWTTEAVPYPGGAAPTEPGAVSCSSVTACTVLSVQGESAPPSPTVVAWWDGETWTGAATDAGSPATALSCTSPTACTATGDGVAQRLDGSGWSGTTLPAGSSPGEVFVDVSCAADDDCVAVGSGWTLRDPDEGPLLTPTLQRSDGETWTDEDAGDDDLRQVSCASPTSCVAAGSALGSFWTRHGDATGWQALPTVTDPRVGGVSGLSCATPSWCLLTTTGYSGGGDLAWVWTGGSAWSPATALPAGSGTVTGVSCTAPGECVAVSNWVGPAAHRLSGGTWAPLPVDGLGLDTLARFDDVACTAAAECVVVGTAGYDDGAVQGLLAVLGDGEWRSTVRPGVGVVDVDCWSGDGCVAVASGSAAARLEVWDGVSWRVVEGPGGVARPTGVSCGAPERCAVIGSFVDGDDRAVAAAVVVDT